MMEPGLLRVAFPALPAVPSWTLRSCGSCCSSSLRWTKHRQHHREEHARWASRLVSGVAAALISLRSRRVHKEARVQPGCVAPRQAQAADRCFSVVPVAGKGLGAVANRDISCGELVIGEKPEVTFNSFEESWLVSIQEQFDALALDRREMIMSLCDANVEQPDAPKTLAGIVTTNSIGSPGDSFDGMVCETISRFNHSCVPNCEQTWDEDTSEERLYASTGIRAGEELCISYVNPFASFAERAEELLDQYRFRCNCPACNSASVESDNRHARLQTLVLNMSYAMQEGYSDKERGIQTAKEMMKLCDEEGLTLNGFRTQACLHAFRSCLASKDVPEAELWAREASRYCEMCRGARNSETVQLRDYAANARSHPAYSDPVQDAILGVGALVAFLAVYISFQGSPILAP